MIAGVSAITEEKVTNTTPCNEMPYVEDAVRFGQGGLNNMTNLATIVHNNHLRHGNTKCYMMMLDTHEHLGDLGVGFSLTEPLVKTIC